MRLIQTETAAPDYAIVSPASSAGKVLLRVARWPAALRDGDPAGTVVVCTGRSEFIEKYFEVIQELRLRGFAVVVFDWRGQGLSARPLRNPMKGHVRSFGEYESDLDAVVRQVLEPFCPRPWFALAHSMGAAVALHFAARRPDVFRRLVLSAPMLEIARLPAGSSAPLLARCAVAAGLGRSAVPVRDRSGLFFSSFDGNLLTSDPVRFERTAAWLRAEPRLGLGLPTFGWLNAAFDSMAGLQRTAFAETFRTPTLVAMPGSDRVVGLEAVERFVSRSPAAAMVLVHGARHEILMERDALRQQFWSAFDAFVPGTPASDSGSGPEARATSGWRAAAR